MQNDRCINAALLWNSLTLEAFSDDSRLVYCYLLTHPTLTSLGAIYKNLANLAKGLNGPLDRFQIALKGCIAQNLVVYDETFSLLWLIDFFDHDRLHSPHQVMAWQVDEAALPDCPLKENIIARALCETRQVLESYFPDPPFETDERIPLFVRAWLQTFKTHFAKTEEHPHGTIS